MAFNLGGFRSWLDELAMSVGFKPRKTAPTNGAVGTGIAPVWFDSDDSKLKYTFNGVDYEILGTVGSPAFVNLQSGTPGTQQTGNSNVSGTARSGVVEVGAADAYAKISRASAAETLIEGTGSSTDVAVWVKMKGAGIHGVTCAANTTNAILMYPEPAAQSAIVTSGSNGIKISSSSQTGRINLGGPGSNTGVDDARHKIEVVPDKTSGPQILAGGGTPVSPGVYPTERNLILSPLGSASQVQVKNEADNAFLPLDASQIRVGGTWGQSVPYLAANGAELDVRNANTTAYTRINAGIVYAGTYVDAAAVLAAGVNTGGTYIVDHTSATENLGVTAYDMGCLHTNVGTSTDVALTLPAAAKNKKYGFFAASDTYYLKVIANTGDVIYLGTDVSASAGYIRSKAAGSVVWLVGVTDGIWAAMGAYSGTWSKDS
jgi:hypothetical protein